MNDVCVACCVRWLRSESGNVSGSGAQQQSVRVCDGWSAHWPISLPRIPHHTAAALILCPPLSGSGDGSSMVNRRTCMRRLAALDRQVSQHPPRCVRSSLERQCWSAASIRTSHERPYHCSRRLSSVGLTRRLSPAPSNPCNTARVLHRSFADSALQRVAANLGSNQPLQLWIAGGLAVGSVWMVYNEYFAENREEVKVWNKAAAVISQSTLPQSLHGLDRSRLRVVKGNRLSGYTEATDSDVWYEMRIVEDGAKEGQDQKDASASSTSDGRVLGLYKVRVSARRERPVVPLGLTVTIKKKEPSEVVELDKASPEWQLQSLVLSAPSLQRSYHIDPATKVVRRADQFIPPTPLPSKAPTAADAPKDSTSAPNSSSSTLPRLSWSSAFLGVCAVGAGSVGAVYALRYWRRQQLLDRLKSAVQTSLSASPLPLGGNVRVARVTSIKIGDAMMRAELDVVGGRAGSAGSGRVRVQAVRSSRAGQMSDWQVVHSQLATNDGRTLPLSLPNLKS